MAQTSKAFPYQSFIPNYINGLQISNDATTPNTLLDIAAGNCLDSSLTFQINLPAAVVINAAVNGLNGLDAGALAASKIYAVYLVADPVTNQASGCMLSLSLSAPALPFGYSAYKLIGYAATDGSSHLLLGYWSAGNTSERMFMYDAPQATAVTAGHATTYTAIDLSATVPAQNLTPVYINSAYTPNSAGNTLKLQPQQGTGDAIVITGQVASVIITNQSLLFSNIASAKPEINYKVANGSDAAAINVAGYKWFV